MEWLIIVAVIVIIWLLFQNSQLAKGRTVDVRALFDLADNYYNDVQEQLQKDIDKYSREKLDSLAGNLVSRCCALQEMYDLSRRHVVTVIASDNNSNEAKISVVNSWLELMRAEKWVEEAIEAGIDQDESMQHRNNAQSAFVGVMEAHGYNLQEEQKELEAKHRKYLDKRLKAKTKKKKIVKQIA